MGADIAGNLPHLSTVILPLRGHCKTRVICRVMDADQLKRRIEERLRALELTPRAASIKAGGSPDLIRGLLRGRQRNFRGENLTKLAEVLGVSVAWLLTGEKDHVPSEEVAAGLGGSPNTAHNGHSTLENYKAELPGAVPEVDARAGAGDGNVGEHEVVTLRRGETYVGHKVTAEWVFPRAFLRHELRTQPGHIIVIEVVGDSMSPTLESGDRLIVDAGHSRPSPDGIYVIDEGDGPMVKRIQLVRRSDPVEIRIISDNPRHEAYTLLLSDVRVIGRVSGRVTRM